MRVPRLRRWAVAVLAVAAAGVVAVGFGVAWSFRADPVPVPEVTAPTPLDGARAAPNSISGRVVRSVFPVGDDWSDFAETSRTVTLLVDGGPSRTTTTDDWGRFAFTEVEPGRPHTVVVEAPERATVRLPGIVLLPGERRDLGRLASDAPSKVEVTVTDDAGRPIEGAEVEAFADVFDDTYEQGFPMPEDLLKFERVPSSRARSAADGRAVLDVFRGVAWTIAAQAPGKARVVVPRRGWQTRWIALPDAAPLRGHVRDATGAPLASALVLARVRPPIRDSHHGTRYESPALWHRTRTAADGSFVFTSLPPGTIDLLAGPAGSAPFAAHAVRFPDCSSVDIEVPGDAHISGRITDAASGAPIEGVVVIVREKQFGSADHCATDADGRYEFAAPGTGTWDSVRVAPPPGWTSATPFDRTYDAMLPGDRRTSDFTLRRTGTLTGRVPDAIGCENGVRVHAVFDGERVYGRRSRGVVLADGRFLLEDVAAGRVAVFACALDRTWWAQDDNWTELRHAINADPAALARASFDLPACHAVHATLALIPAKPVENPAQYELTDTSRDREYRVRIRVRTSDGGPLSDPWGYTSSYDPPPLPSAEPTVQSACCSSTPDPEAAKRPSWRPAYGRRLDVGGTIELVESAAPGDRIFAIAGDDRHGVAWSFCDAPNDTDLVELEVVLESPPAFRGRVVSGGAPVPNARIFDDDGAECARTRADGTFEVTARASSGSAWHSVDARFEAAGFVTARQAVGPRPNGELVTIELEPARSLAGRVVDPSGRAVAGVRISVADMERDGAAAVTDADGRFVLRDLPRVPVRLKVLSAHWDTSPIGGFVTDPFEVDVTETTIVATPGLAIEGRVVHPDGTPAAGGRIACEGAGSANTLDRDDLRDQFPDEGGRFRFARLAEGEYVLSIESWNEETGTTTSTARVRAGATDVRIVVPAE